MTGIPGLSIGTTKNDRGHVLNRYCVNFKDENSKPSSASFYFGISKTQKEAFLSACEFMVELGELESTKARLNKIYREFKHETLV